MSFGRFGDSQMMSAAVADVSNGIGYTQASDPYSQALMDFFGAPANQTMVQAYQYYPSTNQTLPDAYEGRNLFLNDTIEGLILSDNEVYTQVLLRWLLTDQIHFTYNTFVFNQTLPSLVPHEGVSRLITSSTESQTFTSQRRGLAFRMEGDFASTPQGAAQYTRNLIQISQACQEMANYAVELALLNCKDYQREWSAQFRERATTYEKIINDEAADFGACALEPGRLEIMIEKSRAVLKARRIVSDACLLWPQAKLHFTMEMNGAKTGYWRLGPEGNKMFEAGPDAMGVIRGDIAVWESREFDVNVGGPRAQPLERSTQVGEFYAMSFGSRRTEDLAKVVGQDANNADIYGDCKYKTSQRDIFIYDLPSDDYRRISFQEALLETETFRSAAPYSIRDEMYTIVDNLNADGTQVDAIQRYKNKIISYNARTGESSSDRLIPALISSGGANDSYIVAQRFADLDYDVLTDKDVRQVAQTILCAPPAVAAALGARVANNAIQATFGSTNTPFTVDVDSRSPMTVSGHAGLVSGSMPLSEATNAFLYAQVGTNGAVSSSAEMGTGSKLNAWLSASMSGAEKNKENEAFTTALNQRKELLMDIAKGLAASNDTNVMAVRAAFRKAFDDNVRANGAYASKKSFATLKADLQRVRDSASVMQGTPADSIRGAALRSALAVDTAANPFATIKTSNGSELSYDASLVSTAAAARISEECINFSSASLAMEGRVLLHGDSVRGVQFTEGTANEWLAEVHAEAKTSAQKASAQRTEDTVKAFLGARESLEQSVKGGVAGAMKGGDTGIFSQHATPGPAAGTSSVESFLQGTDDFAQAGAPFHQQQQGGNAAVRPFARVANSNAIRRIGQNGTFVGGGALEAAARAFLQQPINGATLVYMAENNIHIPFNILLWRLWIQLRMYTGILMESGYPTGASTYGHSNFAMGEEVATKTLTGNFTFYHNAIVWREKAVMHLRNICPRGYEGGWTTRFITRVQDELNNVPPRERGSLLATLVGITENSWNGSRLNFVRTQRVISTRGDQLSYMDRVNLFGTYSGAAYYEVVHGLQDSQQYSFVNSRYADEYAQPNTVAHLGPHFVYNADERKFNKYMSGSGHLSGNRSGRGAKNVWEGNGRLFPDQSNVRYVLS